MPPPAPSANRCWARVALFHLRLPVVQLRFWRRSYPQWTTFSGAFGNAGEISRIYTEQEFTSRPALGELLKRLNAHGIDIQRVSALRQQFDPQWPGVDDWVAEVRPYLNRAIDALRAVIDPAAIVFGGELPTALGEMLLDVPPTNSYRVTASPPNIPGYC